MRKIAAASNNQLTFENGVLTGKNPDGSGDVHIKAGEPISSGQIHDLHHTVPSGGGRQNNGGNHSGTDAPAPMDGSSNPGARHAGH